MSGGWRLLKSIILGSALLIPVAQAQDAKTPPLAGELRRYESIVREPSTQKNGSAWWKLAMLYQRAALYRDSEHAYSRALELVQSDDRTTLANIMDGMGTLYVEMGRYAKAEPLEREALALREAQKDSLGVGLSWTHLAMLSMGMHKPADGLTYAELAVEHLVSKQTAHSEDNAATPEQKMTALIYLSLARCADHDCRAAVFPLKAAMTIARANYSTQSFPVAYIEFIRGYTEWKRGNDHTAAKLMKSGTEGMAEQLGWGHPTYITAMHQYLQFLVQSRRNAEADEVKLKLAHLENSPASVQSVSAEEMLAPPR